MSFQISPWPQEFHNFAITSVTLIHRHVINVRKLNWHEAFAEIYPALFLQNLSIRNQKYFLNLQSDIISFYWEFMDKSITSIRYLDISIERKPLDSIHLCALLPLFFRCFKDKGKCENFILREKFPFESQKRTYRPHPSNAEIKVNRTSIARLHSCDTFAGFVNGLSPFIYHTEIWFLTFLWGITEIT